MQQVANNAQGAKKINNQFFPERLLLFDGVCNLCNRSVQFIIRHDREARFKFAALQSPYAQKILPGLLQQEANKNNYRPGAENDNLFSAIFILRGKIYTRSTAVIKVMAQLGFPWNLMTVFYILPGILRDRLYAYIASHRYKWFGKKDHCMIPTPQLRQRFMDIAAP